MKFQNLDNVITNVDKPQIPQNSHGTIVYSFTKPEEAYEVEFYVDWNIANYDEPYIMATYYPDELTLYK